MLRYPDRPVDDNDDFANRVQGHEAELTRLETAGAGGEPDYPGIRAYIKSNQAWGSGVKDAYMAHQHRKCAYCERQITDHGDVEHYRPKNAIFKLRTAGREKPNLNNVEGRSFHQPDDPAPEPGTYDSGYWWLAYRWDNYFVTCGICNRNWKNALFPVRFGHRRRPRRGDEAKEPYVLDPFGTVDPGEHLEYTTEGGIAPLGGSRHGRETIEVLGLDRPSVVVSRLRQARTMGRKLQQLLAAGTDPLAIKPVFLDIADLGDDMSLHAGMIRTMFTRRTGQSWQSLHTWLAQHP